MGLLDDLTPRSVRQKNGVFLALVIALILAALHNPFSGYATTQARYELTAVYFGSDICVEGWRMKEGEVDYFCQNGRQVSRIPFLEWRSNNAAIPWLSPIGSMLSIFFFIGVGAAIWVVMYRSS